MGKVIRALNQAALATGALYKVVFTGLLLYELVRFRLKKGRHVENSGYRPNDSSYRTYSSLGFKQKARK